jgi:hypothetical protein
VRVIQTTSENYWHGFPPFTWFVTPVITDVAVEYEPSPAELAKVAEASTYREQRAAERWEEDRSHVIPEPRR